MLRPYEDVTKSRLFVERYRRLILVRVDKYGKDRCGHNGAGAIQR
jgi:hypothetical protein